LTHQPVLPSLVENNNFLDRLVDVGCLEKHCEPAIARDVTNSQLLVLMGQAVLKLYFCFSIPYGFSCYKGLESEAKPQGKKRSLLPAKHFP
jgi:hypothetical protein